MARMLTSEEAASRLGVKVTTLYVYVSRGLLESHPDPGSRRSLFAVEDVERLAARSRSGRKVESRLAVVTTSITLLDDRGPVYRGRPATDLATTESFERVAAGLWRVDDDPDGWRARPLDVPGRLRSRDRLPWATVMSGAEDPFRADLRPVAVVRAARTLIATLVDALGDTTDDTTTPRGDVPALVLDGSRSDTGSSAEPAAPISDPIAGRLARSLGLVGRGAGEQTDQQVVRAVNAAMVLLADHELATSTLAVRVAASTRADLYDALLSALGTSAGTLHSAASDLVLEVLEAAATDGVERAMGDAIRRWGHVPGFGHSAYPDGDPRAAALLPLVTGSVGRAMGDGSHRALVQQAIDTAAAQGLPRPNIDFALAALASASGAAPGAMPALFSIARVAGWVAHYLEELDERPLRFRARAIHTTDSAGA